MFEQLTNRLLARAVRRSLPRSKRFVNYESMKTVLLLFESDLTEKNEAVRRIQAQLQAAGKVVVAWGYVDKKTVSSVILPTFHILGRNDIGLFGRPKRALIEELEGMHFDAVIDLCVWPRVPMTYLLLHSWGDCRIGLRMDDYNLLDFALSYDDLPSDEEMLTGHDAAIVQFWERLMPYLKSIC